MLILFSVLGLFPIGSSIMKDMDKKKITVNSDNTFEALIFKFKTS